MKNVSSQHTLWSAQCFSPRLHHLWSFHNKVILYMRKAFAFLPQGFPEGNLPSSYETLLLRVKGNSVNYEGKFPLPCSEWLFAPTFPFS